MNVHVGYLESCYSVVLNILFCYRIYFF